MPGAGSAASTVRPIRAGRVPTLASFHFPVGGPRFHPSLTDVVEVLAVEFGLDVRDGWRRAVRDGRARSRSRDVDAAIHDGPRAAADTLRTLGCQVGWPHPTPGPG